VGHNGVQVAQDVWLYPHHLDAGKLRAQRKKQRQLLLPVERIGVPCALKHAEDVRALLASQGIRKANVLRAVDEEVFENGHGTGEWISDRSKHVPLICHGATQASAVEQAGRFQFEFAVCANDCSSPNRLHPVLVREIRRRCWEESVAHQRDQI
jgi:hypothetical protein